MPHEKLISNLLGIPGWRVREVRLESETLAVEIDREAGAGYRCGGCGDKFLFCYDHEPTRLVRDFQVWGRACWLEFSPARVACPRCGIRTEGPDWIRLHQRQTFRYELYLAHLCDILPVLDVAQLEGMDKSTVYRIDRHWLQRRAETTPMPEVRRLGIDEIAIRKGHRYATVFYDLERRLVVGLVEGRAAKAVSRFFRRWGKRACKAIEAVCMDLWTPFMRVVRRYCPQATIVFDKFHVFTYLSTAIKTSRKPTCSERTSKRFIAHPIAPTLRPSSKTGSGAAPRAVWHPSSPWPAASDDGKRASSPSSLTASPMASRKVSTTPSRSSSAGPTATTLPPTSS